MDEAKKRKKWLALALLILTSTACGAAPPADEVPAFPSPHLASALPVQEGGSARADAGIGSPDFVGSDVSPAVVPPEAGAAGQAPDAATAPDVPPGCMPGALYPGPEGLTPCPS